MTHSSALQTEYAAFQAELLQQQSGPSCPVLREEEEAESERLGHVVCCLNEQLMDGQPCGPEILLWLRRPLLGTLLWQQPCSFAQQCGTHCQLLLADADADADCRPEACSHLRLLFWA